MNRNDPGHERIRVLDSHTGGEPTRMLVEPLSLPGQTMMEKREVFSRIYDWLRTAAICEPRGHEAIVGAALCEPTSPDCVTGVIFFNNVGCLNGCIHGTIGVAVSLFHLGVIQQGTHRFDTPSGVVTVDVKASGEVTVRNVRSYRHRADLELQVPGYGLIHGDIAWGGNWFFLTEALPDLPISFANLEPLTDFAWTIRQALEEAGHTGEDGGVIDHIEIFGAPTDPLVADSRNFVLCPGKAYDRSPCGTGTSAKLACLHASGRLKVGEVWRQAGILDTVFVGKVEEAPGGEVIPIITGWANVTFDAEMIIDPSAPFAYGITSSFI